ncbi:MAG: hypothetical protein ABIJ22_00665 [Patescibacteria group bacterium]
MIESKYMVHEMKGDVDPKHNSAESYEDGTQLSFEFEKAREAGLTYEVAQRIFDLSSGMGSVVNPLIESSPKSVQELDEHIKGIDCWGDGSDQSIADALVDHF